LEYNYTSPTRTQIAPWSQNTSQRSQSKQSIIRLRMSFSILMEGHNSEIWMYRRLRKMDFCIHKQELLIMQVHRFGANNLMIISLIFGRWVVWYIRWRLSKFLLRHKIWKDFLRQFLQGNSVLFQIYFPNNWVSLLAICFN